MCGIRKQSFLAGVLGIVVVLFVAGQADNSLQQLFKAKSKASANIVSEPLETAGRTPAGEWAGESTPIRLGTVHLSEGFEGTFPPTDWTIDSTHTGIETWHQKSESPYEGFYYAACEWDPESVPQEEWLISPLMDLSSPEANVAFAFSWMLNYFLLGNYNLLVVVSTNGGASFPDTLWDAEMDAGEFETFVWYRDTLSLDAYRESEVKIAFKYVDWDGALAGVDMVEVFEWMHEDFELSFPPMGWSVDSTHTDTMTWYQDDYDPYSGDQYVTCQYDPDLVLQDEWLKTPALDLSGKTSNVGVVFSWFMSYYWAVDPFDNYNLELWISTDSGSTFPDKLWSETDAGTFDDWVWYRDTVGLNDYLVSNVVLGWRYYGTDGAEAAIDLVEIIEFDPPDNDAWVGAILLEPPYPVETDGTTRWATPDCPGVLDKEAVWYKFPLPYDSNLVYVNYCGSDPTPQYFGVELYVDDVNCPDFIVVEGYPDVPTMGCPGGDTVEDLQWILGPGDTAYLPIFTGNWPATQEFHFTVNVVDLAPPVIVGITPGPNALNVPLSDSVSVQFNVAMNPATINQTTFMVSGSMSGLRTGSYSFDTGTNTASFHPLLDFHPGEEVSVLITTGMEAAGTSPLDSNYHWSFRCVVPGGEASFDTDVSGYADRQALALAGGDFDGDGDIDIAISGGDSIYVWQNDGNGSYTLSSATYISSGATTSDIATVDFNNDNVLDLVIGCFNPHSVAILTGSGDCSFAEAYDYPLAGYALSVCPADFNGDGWMDIAVSFESLGLDIFINDGTGNMTGATDIGSGTWYATDVVAADFNEDGHMDLVEACYNGYDTIFVRMGNGDGTFGSLGKYDAATWPTSVVAADFNNDGHIDLVSHGAHEAPAGDNFSVIFGDGLGQFSSGTGYDASDIGGGMGVVMGTGDIDGDGDIDIVAVSTRIDLYINDGSGLFTFDNNLVPPITPLVGWGFNDIVLADLNSDGWLDLSYCGGSTGFVVLPGIPGDVDGDGIPNGLDNCPNVANAGQEDADEDGLGDACDECTDTDGDGLGNPGFPLNTCEEDLCPTRYDPTNADSDGDGVGDACTFEGTTDPGSNVTVPLGTDITLTFTQVDVGGTTELEETVSGPAGPANLQLIPLDIPVYYNITTTATYSGNIEICLQYSDDGLTPAEEGALTLHHYDGAVWVDITSSLDVGTNTICGITDDLSPFVGGILSGCCNHDGIRGDVNYDMKLNVSDLTYLVSYLFKGGPAPPCFEEGDVNGDGKINVSDLTYLVTFLFKGGPPPVACP